MKFFHIHKFEPFSATRWNKDRPSYPGGAFQRMVRVIMDCRCGEIRRVDVPVYDKDELPLGIDRKRERG